MAYPFQREPELSESNFSILQHKAIEEIMDLKLKNKRDESLKISLEWINKSTTYPNINEERSTLEGLSKLYYFVACDLEIQGKSNVALPYHEKSNEIMEKCCSLIYSQLYSEELANGYYLYARKLVESGNIEKALTKAQKSLNLFYYLINQPGYEFNVELEDGKNNVEEFIDELTQS